MKAILLVLDSVGIGEAPDAGDYGDIGAATLPKTARASGRLTVPILQSMGLGNITSVLPDGLPITGVPPATTPIASYGAMQECSHGKDTITGHWEIAGLQMIPGFTTFPAEYPSFPITLIESFEKQTGRKVIGNRAASGIGVIEDLGEQQMKEGAFIVYTSSDSVFQIAAHVDIIPLEELYGACRIARTLCDPLKVGRVIARPFRGSTGQFERTKDRRDFSYASDETTILQRLTQHGIPVYAVGKIEDIFGRKGITESNHTGDTESSQNAVLRFFQKVDHGLIFANFIDFDMIYGHRRDPIGYAKALEHTDAWLGDFLPQLAETDTLIITADHGNDPTFKGTDHTREYVPLLVYQPGKPGCNLGIRSGFFDVAQSLSSLFNVEPMPRGISFL